MTTMDENENILSTAEEVELTPADSHLVEDATPAETVSRGASEKEETPKKQAPKKKKCTAGGKEDGTSAVPVDTSVKKEGTPRLKASLREGFQLKGRYYSRACLGRKSVLEALYKQYPGLFEKGK